MVFLSNINIRTKTEPEVFSQLDVLSILYFHLSYFTIQHQQYVLHSRPVQGKPTNIMLS